VNIIGIDTYGSVFKKYHETGYFDHKEIYSYVTEGIGEDILPKNVDFDIIDKFEKVTDKDGLIYQRKLAREEGMMVGNSAGSAVSGVIQLKDQFKPDDVVVLIFHDHGSRYIGKAYNDDWMRERGFLEDKELAVQDILGKKGSSDLISVSKDASIVDVLKLMEDKNISQIPVTDKGDGFVGRVSESKLFREVLDNPENRFQTVETVIEEPLPVFDENANYSEIKVGMENKMNAVLIKMKDDSYQIISKHDIIHAITK